MSTSGGEINDYLSDIILRAGALKQEFEQLQAAHRKEIVDLTARSIEGRMEAWDLIDKMIPYVQHHDGTTCHALLAEIEEKRKPHG